MFLCALSPLRCLIIRRDDDIFVVCVKSDVVYPIVVDEITGVVQFTG